MVYTKKFVITMNDGSTRTVIADYYSYDAGTYVFWKYDENHEAQEVSGGYIPMVDVKGISSYLEG